jgi:peptidoglycan/LPS O-acetylase OafA/YrhL
MPEASRDADFKGRIPELDGIRGIAIAMILAHHYFLLPIAASPGTFWSYVQAAGRLAWSGVDLFFVLSGFLIGGILLDARNSPNYFSVFYTRRFFRIVPIYSVCLAGAYFLSLLVDHGHAAKLAWMFHDRFTFKPYLLFLQNFWMAKHSSYGIFGLGVTWSLAVEEQFYLTLPCVIRFVSPRRLVGAVLTGIVLAPALRIVLYALWPARTLSWVVLMPCRADALLFGVLAAVAVRNFYPFLHKHRAVLPPAVAVLATGFLFLTVRAPDPYRFGMLSFGFTWLALLYCAILLCALLFPGSFLARILRWHWLGWLGSIAYGTYLLHEFIRSFCFGLLWGHLPEGMSLAAIGVSFGALATTLAVCELSWIAFEKPLILIGHKVGYKPAGMRSTEEIVGTGAQIHVRRY